MNISLLSHHIHQLNVEAGWWDYPNKQDILVVSTKLALCHRELSKALEGFRKDLLDNRLPHRKMAEVELADAVIRILDLAKSQGFDLTTTISEKLLYNAVARITGKKI